MGLGPTEILVIALIALLVFGGGRIADIGKGLGQSIKNFKRGLSEDEPEGSKRLPSAKSGGKSAE